MHHCILNSKVLDTCLAYVCLLDLVRKPRWAVCRLVDDVDASCEDVDSLGSTLTQTDVCCPRVAAFSAAPRGCRLANTWLVSFPSFMRTKYFFSPIGYTSYRLRSCQGYNVSPVKPLYCATYWPQWAFSERTFEQ